MDIKERKELYARGYLVVWLAGDEWVIPKTAMRSPLWLVGKSYVFMKVTRWDESVTPPEMISAQNFQSNMIATGLEYLVQTLGAVAAWPAYLVSEMFDPKVSVFDIHRACLHGQLVKTSVDVD